MDNLGAMIRAKRIELGITQRELGNRVGLTQGQVSRIESGKTDVSFLLLRRLENALGCSIMHEIGQESETHDWFGIDTLIELEFLFKRREFDEMLEIIERSVNADFFRKRFNRLRLLFWEAKAYQGMCKRREAIEKYLAVLSETSGLPDLSLAAKVNVELGLLYQDEKEYRLSLEYLESAQRMINEDFRLQFDTELMYSLHYALGVTYAFLGDMEQALAKINKAVRYIEDLLIYCMDQSGRALFTLGAIYALTNRYEEALETYNKTLVRYEYLGDRKTSAKLNLMNNIAYTLKLMGRHQESEETYKRVIDLANQFPECVSETLLEELRKEGYDCFLR
jgi:transcriptional regulator with XRE-family HTH domain